MLHHRSLSIGLAVATPFALALSLAAPTPASAVTNCPPGYHLECDPNCEGNHCGKPICTCEVDPPTPVTGTVSPSFYVTHVVYAPPGRGSSVNYTAGNTFGSTTSTSHSFKNDTKISVAGKAVPILFGGDFTVTGGRAWGSTDTDVTDISVETMQGYRKPGEIDGIDHDNDEIWFLMNPSLDVTVTPATPESSTSVSWQFSANQTPAPYYVYVKDLKHPEFMSATTKQVLDSHGITPAAYPELLKADPFAWGDPGIDPSRFDYIADFPYMPPSNPSDQPSTQTYAITRKENNSSDNKSEVTYTADVKVSTSGSFFGLFTATLALQNTMTWTSSTSHKQTAGNSAGETLTIAQPSFDYAGPGIVRVFMDKIWKTYVCVLVSQ
jgi:hypothetical protein